MKSPNTKKRKKSKLKRKESATAILTSTGSRKISLTTSGDFKRSGSAKVKKESNKKMFSPRPRKGGKDQAALQITPTVLQRYGEKDSLRANSSESLVLNNRLNLNVRSAANSKDTKERSYSFVSSQPVMPLRNHGLVRKQSSKRLIKVSLEGCEYLHPLLSTCENYKLDRFRKGAAKKKREASSPRYDIIEPESATLYYANTFASVSMSIKCD